MNDKKDCLFQYAVQRKYTGVQIYENTGLISLKEVKSLYHKYLDHFLKEIKDDNSPEMVIWIDCDNDTDYKKSLVYLDYQTRIDESGRLYFDKREYYPEI